MFLVQSTIFLKAQSLIPKALITSVSEQLRDGITFLKAGKIFPLQISFKKIHNRTHSHVTCEQDNRGSCQCKCSNIKFCEHKFASINISFYEFDEKLQKFVLQKGFTSYLVSKIFIAKVSKMYKFGHILKITCKKFAFDKLHMGKKF